MRVGLKKNSRGFMDGSRKDSAGLEKRSALRLQGACMHMGEAAAPRRALG
jgi:hypothetical protein